MPFRRCIAPVSSKAFTARSTATSPQITSLTLLPEPPKSSPTVPLNDAPDLLLSAILTKMDRPERMPRVGDGCTILFLERGGTIHIEEAQALQGESVILRPPRKSDVEVVYSWDRDPELAAWNGRSPISISLSAARRDYLARWEDPSVKTFIIEAREGGAEYEVGEAIGLVTLYDFKREGCELGIKIGPKDLRGRGYASEAVELLVSYCFETLNLKVVRGSTLAHNQRMQSVFEKARD